MTRMLISKPAVRVADVLDERCDRCGARARLIAYFPSGRSLAFCGHHANRHAAHLTETAGAVVVEPHFAWRGVEEAAT
ncbi:MAG: hypothetical protein HKP61_15800 [Dactylosporangium sp.]|nr:hypothetical protein [Dactylosporangium sp.]NNJ62369.1 hypothetical protein [Dactylosporangium sp.]